MAEEWNSREQKNVRVLQEAFEAFKRGDMETVARAFSPEAKWTMEKEPEKDVRAGVDSLRGRDAIARHFQEMIEREEVIRFDPQQFIPKGDQVVVIYEYEGLVRETGRSYRIPVCKCYRMDEGGIVESLEFYDPTSERAAYTR
jgi:ketosteroid isomerase-like protein